MRDRTGECWMFKWTQGNDGPTCWGTVIIVEPGTDDDHGGDDHRGLYTDANGRCVMANTSEDEQMTFEDQIYRNLAWRIG